MMKTYRFIELKETDLELLCERNPLADVSIMETCAAVFSEVERRGDEAVREYSARFDGAQLADFQVSPPEFQEAAERVDRRVREAMERAARNIERFHQSQALPSSRVEVEKGVDCWRENRAIDSVGLYIPAGNAPLPSTVLMLAVPARLAGCRRVVACAPPRADGSIVPEVLAAAEIAGIKEVFKIGGAQAVAAMAIGTETVPRVDKILGPGNRWVQGAKLLAALRGVAIDMVAGPSEVLVVADETAVSAYVAADLIAQAEHGADSRAILVSDSESLIRETIDVVNRQIVSLPRKAFAEEALRSSFALLTPSIREAVEFSNLYAPEHLILHVKEPSRWVRDIRSAGSVFLGPWSPEVAGDYASGTNHTLPTSGMARAFSGVSLDTFVKKITFQELSREGLMGLSSVLQTLADVEGLEGHRRAVKVRADPQGRRKSRP
jgi:histidinol dehydrogenase